MLLFFYCPDLFAYLWLNDRLSLSRLASEGSDQRGLEEPLLPLDSLAPRLPLSDDDDVFLS